MPAVGSKTKSPSAFRITFDQLKGKSPGALLAFEKDGSYSFYFEDAICVAGELRVALHFFHEQGATTPWCRVPTNDVQRLADKSGQTVTICTPRQSSVRDEENSHSSQPSVRTGAIFQMSRPAWRLLQGACRAKQYCCRADAIHRRRGLSARSGIELRKSLKGLG
jgi:MutS domain I